MIHRISYQLHGEHKTIQSSLLVDGEDAERTAMAKTVGLPLALAVKLFIGHKIAARGVIIPTALNLCQDLLAELSNLGIKFHETSK